MSAHSSERMQVNGEPIIRCQKYGVESLDLPNPPSPEAEGNTPTPQEEFVPGHHHTLEAEHLDLVGWVNGSML